MTMSNASVSQVGHGMGLQFGRQKKRSATDVSKRRLRKRRSAIVLENPGWTTEAMEIAIVRVVGDFPGAKAPLIARKVADIIGLSPKARKIKTPYGSCTVYEKGVHGLLHILKKNGVLWQSTSEGCTRGSGPYTLTDKGRVFYQELTRPTPVVTSDSTQPDVLPQVDIQPQVTVQPQVDVQTQAAVQLRLLWIGIRALLDRLLLGSTA